jgi:hypothetical protein
MLKLALQRGLHLEIAYSPLIADAASRRQAIAEAKVGHLLLFLIAFAYRNTNTQFLSNQNLFIFFQLLYYSVP